MKQNYEPTIQAVREMALEFQQYARKLYDVCDHIRITKDVKVAEAAINLSFNLEVDGVLKVRRAMEKALSDYDVKLQKEREARDCEACGGMSACSDCKDIN